MFKKLSLCAFLCVLLYIFGFTVCAVSSEISTYTLSEQDRLTLIKNTDLQLLSDDSNKLGLSCFGVDNEGNYALGFTALSTGYVYVYNQSGTFQYGYRFRLTGIYGIELCEQGIQIFDLRSETISTYDKFGTCVDVKGVAPKAVSTYSQNYIEKETKQIGQNTYQMERELDIGSYYSKFSVIDSHGNETVLYRDATAHYGQVAGLTLGVLIILFGIVVVFKKLENDEIRKTENGSPVSSQKDEIDPK